VPAVLRLAIARRRARPVAAPPRTRRIDWFEDLEGAHEALVDGHHRTAIVELAAIVGRREDGHERAVAKELVAILHHLMRPDDEVEVVAFEEFGDHVGTKREGDAAVVLGPARNVLIGV